MTTAPESVPGTPGTSPRPVVVAIFVCAVVAAGVLTLVSPESYAFLFGPLNLLLWTAVLAALGGVALRLLVRYGWFDAGSSRRSGSIALGVGACLTVPVIVVDAMGGFPAEVNVRFPESLLFYPSIALVAESVFHLVPLAVLASLWRATRFELDRARWFAMGAVALLEPMLQVGLFMEQSSWTVAAFLGLYVLAFNLMSLELFRRSGFVALYAMRLGYYLLWHIVWGYVRIPLLFGAEV